jgi:8-oxoguanine deaminase
MRLGSGVCRVNDLRDGGSPVSLGVDGSASNDSGHMLNEARFALFLTRVVHGAESMTVEKVLEMATLDGARNLGRTADLGSVEVGKCADFAVFPAEDIWSNGAENKVHALLLCHPRTVETLVIQGEVRVSEGQLVGVDLPKLLEHHRKTAARIHERR